MTSVDAAADPGHTLATGAAPWIVSIARGTDPAAVRRAVLAVVAEHSLPLSSIRAVVPSLEDIYRRAVAQPLPPRTVAERRPGSGAGPVAGSASAKDRPRPVMRGRPRTHGTAGSRPTAGGGMATAPGASGTPVAPPASGSGGDPDDVEPVIIKEEGA